MKRLLPILFLLCALSAHALSPTNSTGLNIHWDSQATAEFGQRQTFVLYSYYINMYPSNVISPRDSSRSGGSNWEDLTNRVQKASIPHWYMTRGNTNIWDFYYKSSNGGEGSNISYTNFQGYAKAPSQTYNTNALLTNDLPVVVNTNRITSVFFSEVGAESSDAGTDIALANLGVLNVATQYGYLYVDDWSNSAPMMIGIWQTNQSAAWGVFPGGHFGNEIQFALGMSRVHALDPVTNAFTIIIDYNTLNATTQHCSVGSITLSSGIVTLNQFHADRMGPAFYHPSATQTNDMRGGFTLIPGISNYCCEIIRMTNCPVGLFTLYMDGVLIGQFSNVQLERGINLWTDDMTSPLRQQMDKGLDILCDSAHVNTTNASDTRPFNELWTEYGSFTNPRWATNSGMTDYAVLMQDKESLLLAQDQLGNANAQQTNHTVLIAPALIIFAPFHR